MKEWTFFSTNIWLPLNLDITWYRLQFRLFSPFNIPSQSQFQFLKSAQYTWWSQPPLQVFQSGVIGSGLNSNRTWSFFNGTCRFIIAFGLSKKKNFRRNNFFYAIFSIFNWLSIELTSNLYRNICTAESDLAKNTHHFVKCIFRPPNDLWKWRHFLFSFW